MADLGTREDACCGKDGSSHVRECMELWFLMLHWKDGILQSLTRP